MTTRQFGSINRPTKPILLQTGTINTNVGQQYIVSANIPEPSVPYRKFIVVYENNTGQSLANMNINAPNITIGSFSGTDIVIQGKSVNVSGSGSSGGLVSFYCEVSDPYLFLFGGNIQFQFNLSSATTVTGTINWAFYGFE